MTATTETARPTDEVAPGDAGPDRRRLLRDRTWQVRSVLVALVLVGAVVRVVGSRFGFPLFFHPDEWAVVDGVIDMARRNSFEPPWSLRPDHVEMKLDYLVFSAYAAIVKGASVESAFAADPTAFYLIARLITAAWGIATIVLAYHVGRRWSRRVGLVAAALFALFPPFVNHAHYATPDVPLTFALLLMVYALMRYVDSCSWASLLWASLALALAVGIKYPGAVGGLMIAAVVVAAGVRDRAWRRTLLHGAGSAGAALGFLFLISPSLFTNISGVRAELKIQSAGGRLGNPDRGLLGNMAYYLDTYLEFSGFVLAALVLVGLVVVARRRRLDTLPWFTGVLVWISLSTFPMVWERWGLPMWITPLFLAAVGFCWLVDRLRETRARVVPTVVAGVVALQLTAGSAGAVAALRAPDTRTRALAFAEEHGITARQTMYEGYTPYSPRTPKLFFEKQVREDGAGGYRLLAAEGTEREARYVMLSSTMYDRVLDQPGFEEESRIYRWIIAHYDEIATFESVTSAQKSWPEPITIARNLQRVRDTFEGGLTGPTIRVFEKR